MADVVGLIFILLLIGAVALLAIVGVLYVGAGIATVIFGGAFLEGLWDIGAAKVEVEGDEEDRTGGTVPTGRWPADPADGY